MVETFQQRTPTCPHCASVKPGPGTPLVQLTNAHAAIGAWRARAEMRWLAFNQAVSERDALAAAARRAKAELSLVNEHHESLPAEAASALTNAIRALQSALV